MPIGNEAAIKDGATTIVDMNTGESEPVASVQLDKGVEALGPRRKLAEELQEASNKAIEREVAELERPAKKQRKIENPEARARRLETERTNLQSSLAERDQQIQDMQIQMQRMQEDMYNFMSQSNYTPQEFEDAIDPELDPIGSMNQNLQRLYGEIRQMQEEARQSAEIAQRRALVNQADQLIAARAAQNPQDYRAAMDHLAGVVYQHANQNLAHLTTRERRDTVDAWIKQQKADWIAQGINPADMLYKIAQDHGYNATQEEDDVDPQEDVVRAQIQKTRRRTQNTPNIGGIAGVAPANFSASTFMNQNEDQFNHTVDNMIKAGKLRAGKTGGKTPSLQDLLPGKAIRLS